jgi:dihydroorotase
MLGLETAASIAQLVLIDSGRSSWARLAEVMSITPAKISGMARQGQEVSAGSIANLVLVNPEVSRLIQDGGQSKSTNQPYRGMTLPGLVVHTLFRGSFTVRDSELVERVQ